MHEQDSEIRETSDISEIIEVGYVPDGEQDNDPAEPAKEPSTPSRKAHKAGKTNQELHRLQQLLEATLRERDDFKDRYLRNLAEIDNYRKRLKREKEEFQKYTLGEFFRQLLEVFDNLERALNAPASDPDSLREGVEMIHRQLGDLLTRHQVTEIPAQGEPFDPNVHQALTREEREGIDLPQVIEVYQKGFRYLDKLLRPALTKVAVPQAKDSRLPDTRTEA